MLGIISDLIRTNRILIEDTLEHTKTGAVRRPRSRPNRRGRRPFRSEPGGPLLAQRRGRGSCSGRRRWPAASTSSPATGETLADAFREIGWGPLLLSGVLALLGTRSAARRLGLAAARSRAPARRAVRRGDVFFVTQLGKYLPGLVWPAVAQMEAGRRWGARRRVMLAANLMLLVVLTATGAARRPGAAALGRSGPPRWRGGAGSWQRWPWSPCGPRCSPPCSTGSSALAGREPPGLAITGRAMAGAVAWALVVWVLYGLHVWVLVRALGGTGADALVASVGGMALGWAFGLVAILAPAGVGVRDGDPDRGPVADRRAVAGLRRGPRVPRPARARPTSAGRLRCAPLGAGRLRSGASQQ